MTSTQLENFCQESARNYDERMQQATNERRQNERVVSRSKTVKNFRVRIEISITSTFLSNLFASIAPALARFFIVLAVADFLENPVFINFFLKSP